MPIFDYACPACGHQFEHLVRAPRDQHDLHCPACGRAGVQRQLSVPATPRSTQRATPNLPMGGCGRCGDPNGSCGLQ